MNEKEEMQEQIEIYFGDCLGVMQTFEDNTFDSMVTDPPAGIAFMGKDWDDYGRAKFGFINAMIPIFSECFRVLKPGAHALVWSIPRTSHWTAWALEEAGFEIRDKIAHVFGSGFPKSLDISKSMDRMAGMEREIISDNKHADRYPNGPGGSGFYGGPGKYSQIGRPPEPLTAPSTDAAKEWNGWGTALKPAREDWLLCRKPISEKTIAENVLKWGVGGLNIDGCRIPSGGEHCRRGVVVRKKNLNGDTRSKTEAGMYGQGKSFVATNSLLGRFPANLILTYPDDEYVLRDNVMPEQLIKLGEWLNENA